MIEECMQFISALPAGLIFLALTLMILAAAGMIQEKFSSYSLSGELTVRDNPAVGVSLSGYYLGMLLIICGTVYDPRENLPPAALLSPVFAYQALAVLVYSALGIIMLNLARVLSDRLMLPRFQNRKEIIEDRNVGTGAVEFGVYVASALIVAGAISGESGGPWWSGLITAVVFFLLGQVVLVLYGWLYQKLAGYDVHGEIEKDNIAAGVAFAGNLIALGILMLRASGGHFYDWETNLTAFGIWAVVGLVLLLPLRWAIDLLFLIDATIKEEIVRDRNLNAAFLESAVLIGVATLITFAI